ncbi:MAG: hypothetical protein PHW79_03990 [Candidatus Marinimicrobia bacterium]|nr:hypothetical protein [Candidatus Neomarinimicrobiota bacterium]
MKKILSILMIVLTISALVFGAEYANKPRALEKTTKTSDVWMNCNRMNGVFRNNGTWFYDNVLGDWGLEWPQGSGLSPIFAAGQYVGAKINGEIRVAGVQHSASEFQAGMINTTDVPYAKGDERFRWYELRPDGVGDWASWPSSGVAPDNQGAPLDTTGNPKLVGDQTIYSVWNDLANHSTYGTNKLNAEIHQMAWAFDRANVMGDMVFIKWTLINKSGQNWDDTYFVIWSDPDLGNAGDDLVGCDSTLGLGYCYNAAAVDQNYGSTPPAVGIDFFQGPIIPGALTDTVNLPDGTVMPGKKMLKMTSFIFYNNDDSNQGNPSSGMDVYNYMSGFWRDSSPIVDPSNVPTKFMFSGDPETATGWLDSDEADRRFFMTTGPFTMEPWVDQNGDGIAQFGEPGVQEIVAGAMVAKGSDNLNSATYLKAVDAIAQLAYDINFELPPPPTKPEVTVSELSNEVVLTWNERSELNADGTPYEQADIVANGLIGQKMVVGTEYKEVTDGTFNFSGYTVYQFSDASGSDAVEYAKYGVDEIVDADAYTGARYISLGMNKNSKVGNVGDPLVNGKPYYFGVQARSYCEFAQPQEFPSSIAMVTATPQNHPGERYSSASDSSLVVKSAPVNASIPAGDGSCVVTVVDPSKTTGKYYRVGFNADDTWNLFASATDSDVVAAPIDTLLENQPNQAGDDAYNVVDGLLVKVIGPAAGIKKICELNPNTLAIADANLWGSLNNYGISQYWPVFVLSENAGTSLTRMDRFGLMTPKDYDIIFTDTDSSLLWDYSYDTVLRDTLTGNPSYAPFTIWRIDIDGTRTQLPVCILDADGDGTWNRSQLGVYGPAFDMLYIYDNAAYNPADVATYISTNDGTVSPGYGPWGATYPAINRFMINMYARPAWTDDVAPPRDADGYFYGPPHAGEYIRIYTNKPNTTNDQFIFKAPDAKTLTKADQKSDLKKINVVPNPYYGYHAGEMSIFERYVQFTNLPEKCTIKIFDLAGNLIRKLEKDDATTTLLEWDLKNHYELPVASGVYVYHVDVPKVGEKVGKIAVFTPNERLDTY